MLAHGTGTGKTLTSIWLAKKNCASVLIICPKGLKTNWARAMFENVTLDTSIVMRFKIVSKEEFRRDWKDLEAFDGVIIDEAHTFAGIKSQLYKSICFYMKRHNVQYRWLLTATPFLRNAWNVYCLGKILGVPWNYYSFREKFFYERFMGPRTFWDDRPGMEDEVAALVNQLGSTVKLDDCIDIPDAVFEREYFALTPQQVTATKAVKEALPIVRFTKHHQIAGGTLKGNEYEETRFIPCDKVRRVVELAQANDKIIVSCRYLAEMQMLKDALAVEDFHILTLDGDTKNKQEVVDAFAAVPRCVLLVNAACSEGWQAPTSQIIIFYSYDFSLKNKIQMEGRIRRIDRPQKCTYIALISKDSIDEAVVDALDRKSDFDAAIYNYTA